MLRLLFIWLLCTFKIHIKALWQRGRLLYRQTVCLCLFNWLFRRNFNWIQVGIWLNWIVAGLQRAEQQQWLRQRQREEERRKMVWLWSLTTSSNRKSFDMKHTPRTKLPHAHMCAHAYTRQTGSIWNAFLLLFLTWVSVCVCVSFDGPTVEFTRTLRTVAAQW